MLTGTCLVGPAVAYSLVVRDFAFEVPEYVREQGRPQQVDEPQEQGKTQAGMPRELGSWEEEVDACLEQDRQVVEGVEP